MTPDNLERVIKMLHLPRHCHNDGPWEFSSGEAMNLAATVWPQLIALVEASARLAAAEGGWGADERYVQMKASLEALAASLGE